MNNEKSGTNSEDIFFYSREVDAPRELLFEVWTKKEHLEKWFGPAGSKITACTNDLRPGGMLHYCMEFGNGFLMWGRWVYKEIVPPEKLVFINAFSDENKGITKHPMAPDWPDELVSTVIFEEKEGKTILKLSSRPLNASEKEEIVFRENISSMETGWNGTFAQLRSYLSEIQK
jgi:uncharacterized protein YndB with AHSA1/START domain